MEPNNNNTKNEKNKNNEDKIFDLNKEEMKKIDLKFKAKLKNNIEIKKQAKSHEINSKININNINKNINKINNPNNLNNQKEKNFIDDFEISDGIYDDINNINLEPMWKSDIIQKEIELDLLDIISISIPTKKAKKEYMKSLMSTMVYNGLAFKDKLNESTKKPIIIYDSLINHFNINSIKNMFVYMSYRNGLVNTKFLPGYKNDYTSDCGWGCMVRCCQMMLSRAFIKLKSKEFNSDGKKANYDSELKYFELEKIKEEAIFLFYDKFIEIQKIHINKEIFEIYKKILKKNEKNVNMVELIPPYSIYILTLLGNCPNVFSSDFKIIEVMLKINKAIFNEEISMLHFTSSVTKKKVIENLCEKIDENKLNTNIDYIKYNKEKYIFKKNGIIFISLRLGLQKIEKNYIDIIPKLFNNFHNNIGFVSGKKNRAFYFIGLKNKKLIFADPHFNQNIETDEDNFPSYNINELYLMPIKEMSSELTFGVVISSIKDLELFFNELTWFKQIHPDFIGFDEK